MDMETPIQDFEERVLGVVREAIDYAYYEGVRDALAATEAVEAVSEAEQMAEQMPLGLRLCPCGCGAWDLEYDDDEEDEDLEYDDPRASAEASDMSRFSLLNDLIDETIERLEAVEVVLGLKYTG